MTIDADIHFVTTIDEAWAMKRWMSERRPYIAVDCETQGLEWWHEKPRLLQIGDRDTAWAIPWDDWHGAIVEVLADYDGDVVMHNASFDIKMIEKWSEKRINFRRDRLHDTRVQAHILNPNRPTGLKPLAKDLIDRKAAHSEKILHEAMSNNKWTWATVPLDFQWYWVYGGMDCIFTSRLHEIQYPQVRAQSPIAYDLEMATVWVLLDMERRGMQIDVDYARETKNAFQQTMDTYTKWCKDTYGFSPGAGKKVVEFLEQELFGRYQFTKLTPGGQLALDREVLEDIIAKTDHQLAHWVLNRRRLEKLVSAYLDNFLELADGQRIHPSYNALTREKEDTAGYGARTGRMSISNPSLQNLPRRSNSNPAADAVRRCLTASPDHTLVMCDFDQIEFRLEAYFTQDPALLGAFKEGDFFVNLTRQIFNDPTSDKKDPRRQTTKNAGYAKIYGAQPPKFAATAGISLEAARDFMARLDSLYPGMNQFTYRVQQAAQKRYEQEGVPYVCSPLTGRRFPCDNIGKAYALVNYVIQGTAAEVLKMKNLELVKAGLGPHLALNVHDEVICDVPNEDLDEAIHTIYNVMNDDQLFYGVDLTASVDVGERWGDKMSVEEPTRILSSGRHAVFGERLAEMLR